MSLLLPGHSETFAFDARSPTRHSWIQAHVPDIAAELATRLARLPTPLPTSPARAALARETLRVTNASPLQNAMVAATLWLSHFSTRVKQATGMSPTEVRCRW